MRRIKNQYQYNFQHCLHYQSFPGQPHHSKREAGATRGVLITEVMVNFGSITLMWPKWRQLINYRSNCQFGLITSLWPRWKQLIIYRSLNVETRSFMAAVKNNPPQDTATHPHQQCQLTSKQIGSNTATTTNAAATTATGSSHY